MIDIINLTKTYGKGKNLFYANHNINFSISEGSVVAFLGANGAGKTTLIKIICNLISPTSGHVLFRGNDVAKNPRIAHENIGVVLEGARNLYNFLSIEENLSYFSLLNKLNKNDFIKRKQMLLDLFDLEAHKNKTVNQLSRGMQQKVAIMIAFLKNPDLLILDEPTLGLDIISQFSMKEAIKSFMKREKGVLIICTHDMSVVYDVCEDIAIFNKGQLKVYDKLNVLKISGNESGFSVSMINTQEVREFLQLNNINIIDNYDNVIEFRLNNLDLLFSSVDIEDIIKIEKCSKSIQDLMVDIAKEDLCLN